MPIFANDILQELIARQETLSVGESCTGGGLANEITANAGVSRVFLGSVTTYANSAKEKLLKVPTEILATKGAVSEEVALLMAKNCRELFSSTWSLSTTGIAGPGGGTKEKPVGLVWIGLAGPNTLLAQSFIFANISRLEHRQKTIEQAFEILKQGIHRAV
ncbi:MAG TPA: CinA family protein [Myxococcota bacterium]|nr:CinA family protein [Myxococcota bacterium]